MKQTIQLRLGQHLTMTPQLQQAIRLLQLSTLDLKQEIQEALESNPMLETVEEGSTREELNQPGNGKAENSKLNAGDNDSNNEKEINAEAGNLPDELPVDSAWDDIYDSAMPPSSGTAGRDNNDSSDYLNQRRSARTLHDYLLWQLNLTPFSDIDRAIALAIIDGVNEDGYLISELEEILSGLDEEGIEIDEVEAVLHRLQQFDPPGVVARGLQESLLIQLRQRPAGEPYLDKAITLIAEHFDLLAQQDHNQLKRKLKISEEDLLEITQLIQSLTPRPGTLVADTETQYVVPDVFVSRQDGVWHVELNSEATPKLRVNPEYAKLIRRADNSDDNNYLKNHMQEARWFIKSLMSRNETLLKVATKIVEFQRGFFEHGAEAMRPLVLRDIAESLEMHESTISRVTTQKYMHTPQGTLEFKYFFSSHVNTAAGGECSATAIRALIKKLITAELPKKPLSDNKIASILAEEGINVARRTVAKYRESMAIPPSNERKRLI
ncbi:MAG: RNA polymerase factor sigma-54 [Gammaproteobacteria bacterium]|nr:RNA polymerase factor sigma-54 [Gammaproteobacteria bacterium]MCP5406417.1 RNA polymerase factor sigma-54 [Chromatiaceae bacterium]MCP5408085.1 RNA polymerase factor sigma-54 [Chromatiaceae bacterium]MCP5442984.1 RNA polymerase factor sigma-54 [Chromatiaceae bacterium]